MIGTIWNIDWTLEHSDGDLKDMQSKHGVQSIASVSQIDGFEANSSRHVYEAVVQSCPP